MAKLLWDTEQLKSYYLVIRNGPSPSFSFPLKEPTCFSSFFFFRFYIIQTIGIVLCWRDLLWAKKKKDFLGRKYSQLFKTQAN